MWSKKHTTAAVLSVLAAVFLINWQKYQYYEQDFEKYLDKPLNFLDDNYSVVQKNHPFNELYDLAQSAKDRQVYYLSSRYNFKNKLDIDELLIRVNYFFYPRKIVAITDILDFYGLPFKKGDLIVSDFNVFETMETNTLKPFPVASVEKKQDYFFRREKPYYLFEIINL